MPGNIQFSFSYSFFFTRLNYTVLLREYGALNICSCIVFSHRLIIYVFAENNRLCAESSFGFCLLNSVYWNINFMHLGINVVFVGGVRMVGQ